MRPIRIAYVSEAILGNNSWWRGLGPLLELQRMDSLYSVEAPPQIDWAALRRYDALFLSLPSSDWVANLTSEARHAGVKIICDVDDLYTELPPGNPARIAFEGNKLAVLRATLRMSDLTFVSTPGLKEALLEDGAKDVVVAPNCWPDRMRWPKMQARTKTVLWRGGQLHDGDISEVAEELAATIPDDWTFMVMGGHEPYTFMRAFKGKYDIMPLVDMGFFHRKIVDLRPAVIVHPLIDSRFNRCRSNIAYLEAAYAGATLVAPDFEVFRGLPGALTYGSLSRVMQIAMVSEGAWEARTYIDKHMRAKHGNAIRVEAFDKLFGVDRGGS